MTSVGKRMRDEETASVPSAHCSLDDDEAQAAGEARAHKRAAACGSRAGTPTRSQAATLPESECPSTGPMDSKDLTELVGSRSQMDFCAAYAKQGVKVFLDDDNMNVLSQLRDEYESDISGFFHYYIPAAQKILMPIAAQCGFEESATGAAAFLEHLKSYAAKPEGQLASKKMKEDVLFLCNIFRFTPRKPDNSAYNSCDDSHSEGLNRSASTGEGGAETAEEGRD